VQGEKLKTDHRYSVSVTNTACYIRLSKWP